MSQGVDTEGDQKVRSVFISYSRSDEDFAKHLAEELRRENLTVWQDISGLRGGQEWANAIDEAVRRCDVFVVVLSPESSGSKWVRKETLLAMKQGKRIVPVLLKETEIPVHLVDIQFVDFRGDREVAVRALLNAVSSVEVQEAPVRYVQELMRPRHKVFMIYLLGFFFLVILAIIIIPNLREKKPTSLPESTQPPSTASHSVPGPITRNPTMGTFETEFRQSEMVTIMIGPTLGGHYTAVFHNVEFREQDVGRNFLADVGALLDASKEQLENIEVALYRSLIGPWKGGQTIDMYSKPDAEQIVSQRRYLGLEWKITRPGDYVFCVQIPLPAYGEPDAPMIPLKYARYTVLLSGD